MLWYKAWLETRSRFLIALVGCGALCSLWVFQFGREFMSSPRGVVGLSGVLHITHTVLALVWILAVTLLMMGGLLQEEAVGASSFTLSLPVSRFHLMSVRFGMSLVQAFVLAVVPWIGMCISAAIAGSAYSFSQVFFHLFLLMCGGVFFLALALLISSIVEGQYTAPIVSIGVSVLLVNALRGERLAPYNPWTFMEGSEYFHRQTGLFRGQVPLLHGAAFCAASAVLFFISAKIIELRDF